MKVKALQAVVANIGGASVRLEINQVYDVSEEDADNLIRGKYAEAVEVPVEKKKKGGES